MRKAIFVRFLLALCAAGLFAATSVSAQVSINTTLTTGTMTGSLANAYRTAYLHFQLVNCGDNIPVIPGQPSAVAQDAFDLYPSAPGSAVIGSILGNDQMTCGNVVSTYYVVSVMKDASHPLRGGIPYVICSASSTLGTCSNQASLGAFNLVTADPMTAPPPAPGFSQLYENPSNSQTWTQPLGTVGNFLGSFDFVNGIYVGSTLVADLPALVGLSNVIYVSDGTAGSVPCVGGGTGAWAFYQGSIWTCALGSSGGTGPTPGVFSVSPTILNFNNVAIGVTSPPALGTVTLTNNSATTVTALSLGAPTGTNPADFLTPLNSTCGTSLAASASCSFQIQFRPTLNGLETATISITDSAGTQNVALSGTGFGSGLLSFTPSSFAFGSLSVGQASLPQILTIQDSGSAPVGSIVISASPANYVISSNNCPSQLAALQTCTLQVSYTPSATGAQPGTLTVASNNASSPNLLPLTGSGVATTTWSSLTPSGSGLSVPNTEQMQAVITPSAGAAVPATANANWTVTGGGSGAPWACVTGPSSSCTHNVAGYLTAFNTTLSKALPAETNTIHNLIIVDIFCFLSGNCTSPTVTDTNSNSYTCSAFAADTVNDNVAECYALNNATASNTITCAATGAGAYMACGALELSGNATSSVADGTPTSGFGTAATMVTASLTTTGSYDALHTACFDARYAGGAMTAATNFAIDFQQASTGATMMGEHQFGAAADAYTGGGTDPSASPHWVCLLSAYKGNGQTTPYASITQNGGLLTALSNGTASVSAQGGRMVQTNTGAQASASTSITVVYNSAQTSGNSNIVAVGWTGATNSVSSVTDTAGNSYAAACTAEQANGESVQIWMASPIVPFSAMNGNSVIVTMSASVSGLSAEIAEIFGTVAASVQDGSCVSTTGASGPAAGTLTTVNSTDTVIVAINPAQVVTATSAPFSLELKSSSGDALLDAPAFSATSYASSSTLSGGGYVEQMLALKVVSGSTNVTIANQSVSNVYYISPSNGSPVGNDSNSGTLNAPFLTFAKAFATLLANCPGATGCTLYLEGNNQFGQGFVYQPGTGTGFPNLNCGAGGNVPNGTATAPMTITALNERTAWIKGDGTAQPFVMSNCKYWIVNGLHVTSTNTPSTVYSESGIMYFTNTDHLTATRNLLDHTNQCQNAHGMALNYTNTNFVVQENELYYFHRHGFIAYGGSNSGVFRRNYANYRNYGENACYTGGIPPGIPPVGAGVTVYGSSNVETDDNIVEGAKAIDEEPITGGPYNANNSHYGDVSLNSAGFGFGGAAHDTGASSPPTSISFVNPVVINAAVVPAYMRCMASTTWTNGSIFNSLATAPSELYQQDYNGGTCPSSSTPSSTISHSEIFSSSPVTITGYNIANGSSTISNSGAFNSPTISTATVTSPFTSNPAYGSCYLWAPDGSAAQTAGVGATVLYTTVSGSVTANPLWAAQGTMAATYRGAVDVGSVNDPGTWPGQTLTDIGPRLHIGSVNGCAYPASYTPAAQ